MIGILKYNLSDLDDNLAHRRAVKSLDMTLALQELKEKLRSKLKYEEPKLNDLEEFQDFFFQTLNEYSIDLEDLIV